MKWVSCVVMACAPTSPGSIDPASEPGDTGGSRLPDTPHNVLVVIADDMGVDKLTTYGDVGVRPPLPTLEGLAAQGVVFERADAMPKCAPSRATLITGRYPTQHGVGTGIAGSDVLGLPDDERTLPELLVDRGVHHAILGKWHLGTKSHGGAASALDHGFDHHAGALASLLDGWSLDGAPQDDTDWERVEDGAVTRTNAYATTDTTDSALRALQTLPEPWVVWVAYNAPHVPLHWPPEALWPGELFGDDSDERQFNAMLQAMDTELGRLVAGRTAQQLARTTIVFVGDNGSPPHGVPAPLPADRAKDTLYEGGVHVPLIVTGAAVVAPGRTSALVDATDLLPTIAELVGVDPGGLDAPLNGVSFVGSLQSS